MVILVVSSFIIAPMIVDSFNEIREYNEFVDNIESVIRVDFPDKGTLVYADFQDWIIYGNTVPITRMSYLVFKDTSETQKFETDLVDDSKWITTINDDLLLTIPENIHNYIDVGDYFMIYNITNQTLNVASIPYGINEYFLFIYQEDYNRLIIFEYIINSEEGE